MNIKEEIDKLKQEKVEIDNKIKNIMSQCKHINTKENKYLDYDRNLYEVICLDCGAIIFDGNEFQLKYFREHINS